MLIHILGANADETGIILFLGRSDIYLKNPLRWRLSDSDDPYVLTKTEPVKIAKPGDLIIVNDDKTPYKDWYWLDDYDKNKDL